MQFITTIPRTYYWKRKWDIALFNKKQGFSLLSWSLRMGDLAFWQMFLRYQQVQVLINSWKLAIWITSAMYDVTNYCDMKNIEVQTNWLLVRKICHTVKQVILAGSLILQKVKFMKLNHFKMVNFTLTSWQQC